MPCKIENCTKPGALVRDMCPMHYQRWRKRGDPLWEPIVPTLEDRFWEKVQKSDGCWMWTAGGDVDGYGAFSRNRTQIKAHRYSWELHYGSIQDGLWVLHRCDNPRCVRPDHLFLGTHQENMADMKAKGRSQRGERCHAAKLTERQAKEVIKAAKRGERCEDIARRFGVSRSTVSLVATGKTWAYLHA